MGSTGREIQHMTRASLVVPHDPDHGLHDTRTTFEMIIEIEEEVVRDVDHFRTRAMGRHFLQIETTCVSQWVVDLAISLPENHPEVQKP